MKYYQICWADRYDAGYCGVIPGFFVSKEEAEKCADWHRKHPDPMMNIETRINEIDIDNIVERFVPPMTEEEYDASVENYFHPECEIPDDYYGEYPEEQ